MAVPRARFCDGRAVLQRACHVRSCDGAATVVPRTAVQDSCRVRCRDGRAACGATTDVP